LHPRGRWWNRRFSKFGLPIKQRIAVTCDNNNNKKEKEKEKEKEKNRKFFFPLIEQLDSRIDD